MHFLVAGASGFLGSHLTDHLRAAGHEVTRLTRHEATAEDQSTWDPYAGRVDRARVEAADVVVNVAGSPTVGNPHSKKWARELRESRVSTTRTLAEAIAGSQRKPALLAGNAVGFYGDHGSDVVTEETPARGGTLMSEVCRDWQAAAQAAIESGARVCILRTSPVMDRAAPPLKQLRLLYRLGGGGRLGDGQQHMPMVTLRDWLAAVTFLAEHDEVTGPVNIACPDTPTNAEFTRALARAVRRPAFLAVPSAVLRVGAGPAAPELLGSINVRPDVLEAAGYEFRDRDVEDVLAAALR